MNKFLTPTALTALSLIMTGCTLMQDPNGEGVDPTQVKVEVDAVLHLTLPDKENAYDDFIPDVAQGCVRRFVIEAVNPDGTVADRKVTFSDIEDGKNDYTVQTTFRLHARNYRLLVWSDYTAADDPEAPLCYDAKSLCPVMPYGNFLGNTESKDCFRACDQLDLRTMRDKWDVSLTRDIELTRPVGRYELITADLGAFRKRVESGQAPGSKFTVRVRYDGYRATGYNVDQNIPKNFLSYLFYSVPLKAEDWNGSAASMRIAFDYCLVDPGANGIDIPLEIEVVNEQNTLISRSVIRIPVAQGYNTVVTGRFLTATDDGSVSIDPDFDDVIDIDFGIL